MKSPSRIVVLLCTLLLTASLCIAQEAARAQTPAQNFAANASKDAQARQTAARVLTGGPLRFEKNAGQFDPQVKFASRGPAHSLYLTPQEAVLVLTRRESPAHTMGERERSRSHIPQAAASTVARLRLTGGNPSAAIEGENLLPGRSNYLIGRDKKQWHTGVENFSRVHYRDVYPGIDWVYYGNDGRLEYDFVVAPGSDPSQIAMNIAVDGSTRNDTLRISPDGDLILSTDPEGILFHRPVAYQVLSGAKQPVTAEFAMLAPGRVGFKLGTYDQSQPVVIDPVLNFSTYLGGSDGNSIAYAVAVDSTGIYLAGQTNANNFPTTAGVFQPNRNFPTLSCSGNACYDAFITKLSPDGSAPIYSTYLGGSDFDYATSIAVNAAGEAYIAGDTISGDFPKTASAFQSSIGAGSCGGGNCDDAYVSVLSADGSSLVYSTYLGGSSVDFANAVTADSSGNILVAGETYSSDFPTTLGTFTGDTCNTGSGSFTCGDAFVAKLDPTASGASSRLFVRYLGGQGDDFPASIAALSSNGDIFVVGDTFPNASNANTFPTTGGFQTTYRGGGADAFISRIKGTDGSILYGSFLGGNSTDRALGVALDSTGKAFVAGYTRSTDFQTKSALQASLDASSTACGTGHPCFDAFLAKFDTGVTGASSLTFSTYLGGSDDDEAFSVSVDSSGNPVVSGTTGTPQTGVTRPFPLVTPLQSTKAGVLGEYDAFVTKLNSAGSAITFSTYFGGGGNQDLGWAVKVGPSDSIYLTGSSNSSSLPVTLDSYEPLPQGPNQDAFVVRIDTGNLPGAAFDTTSLDLQSIGVGFTTAAQSVKLMNMGSAALTLSTSTTGTNAADFAVASSSTCSSLLAAGQSCKIDVTMTPSALGTRTANLTVTDNAAGSPHNIALSGTGTAAPKVSLSSGTLAFGSVLFGATSPAQTVTITNTGAASLTITTVAASPADYSKSADTCAGATVTAGNSCSVSVTFTPSANGSIVGSLSITDNAPGSPHTVALTGTGSAPTATLSTTTLAFGNQLVNTTSTSQTVTVTNNGTIALSITSVTPSTDYAVTSTCGTTSISVPTSGHCDFAVTFTPTAAGTRNGTLTIVDNAPGNPHIVTLTGTGTQDFTVAPGSTSATVNAGETATYTFTLAPLGGFNSTITFTCTGAPSYSTCTPPAATALDGVNSKDVTFSVTTQARSSAPPMLNPFNAPPRSAPQTYLPWLAAWLMMAAALAMFGKKRRTALLLAATLAMALAWTACGGGGYGGGGTTPVTGTPAGTYTLSAKATSGSITKTTTLTLKVN